MQDFRLAKLCILTAVVSTFLIIPSVKLRRHIDDAITERSLQKKVENEKQKIELEADRRLAVREKNDTNIATAPDPKSTQISELSQNTSVDAIDDMDKMPIELTNSDPPSRVLTAGPYKGMTPEEVEAYEQRERVWIQRVTENNKRRTQVFDLTSQNMEDRQSLMLSVFKSLSSEQLSHVREEASKL